MPDSAISYTIQRSARRRTIGLYVERDGSVHVKAPPSASDERIEAVVRDKQKWIVRAQARWAALNPQQPQREFVSGETVYFLGQPHRLDFRPDTEPGVRREGDLFVMATSDRPVAESLLKELYRAEGLARIPPLVQQHSSSMGLAPGRVRVQELGHRWASCSAAGTLNFNWKAMAAPVEVLHYLVVHELAHLVHRDHSAQFWRLIETHLPGWKSHAQWLELHGAQMTL